MRYFYKDGENVWEDMMRDYEARERLEGIGFLKTVSAQNKSLFITWEELERVIFSAIIPPSRFNVDLLL